LFSVTKELKFLSIKQIRLGLKKPNVLRTKQKDGLNDKVWSFLWLALYNEKQ